LAGGLAPGDVYDYLAGRRSFGVEKFQKLLVGIETARESMETVGTNN
jgi:hypothetical protein